MNEKEVMETLETYEEMVKQQHAFNEELLQSLEDAAKRLETAKETLLWFAQEGNYEPQMEVEDDGKMINYVSQVDKVGVDKANEALVRVTG